MALSLVLALGIGAVLGLARKPANKTRSNEHDTAIAAADVKQLEAILNHKKRQEEGLLAALEPFLAPANVAKVEKFRAGFELAMELSVFYLDEYKLDEANQFFVRLETINKVRAYHHLGQMGRAIVLALQNKPQESNSLFRELAEAAPYRDLGIKNLEKREGKRNPGPALLMLVDPRFRFWIAEALHYNQRNGIDDKEVPETFLSIRQQAESAARKEK